MNASALRLPIRKFSSLAPISAARREHVKSDGAGDNKNAINVAENDITGFDRGVADLHRNLIVSDEAATRLPLEIRSFVKEGSFSRI